jgi:hypothetical protein
MSSRRLMRSSLVRGSDPTTSPRCASQQKLAADDRCASWLCENVVARRADRINLLKPLLPHRNSKAASPERGRRDLRWKREHSRGSQVPRISCFVLPMAGFMFSWTQLPWMRLQTAAPNKLAAPAFAGELCGTDYRNPSNRRSTGWRSGHRGRIETSSLRTAQIGASGRCKD